MARPLSQNPILINKLQHLIPAPLTFLVVLSAVFSVFSVVTFLCGAHREKKAVVRLGGEKKTAMKKLSSGLSSKALIMAKMISWRKVQDEHGGGGGGEEEEEKHVYVDEDDAVWRKTIMKGERCRPLDFSGKILYDSNGNLISD